MLPFKCSGISSWHLKEQWHLVRLLKVGFQVACRDTFRCLYKLKNPSKRLLKQARCGRANCAYRAGTPVQQCYAKAHYLHAYLKLHGFMRCNKHNTICFLPRLNEIKQLYGYHQRRVCMGEGNTYFNVQIWISPRDHSIVS